MKISNKLETAREVQKLKVANTYKTRKKSWSGKKYLCMNKDESCIVLCPMYSSTYEL